MNREKFYLSTIATDAVRVARDYGLGLEIAEYCTAWNMDRKFAAVDGVVRKKLEGISGCTLHGPYNELFPCAIDPKARELAAFRYRQALELAAGYGATKVVIHGGYHPRIYFPVWYVEQSILFWKEFLAQAPPVQIVLENVLEEEPGMLLDIVRGVDDPRLGLCLDVGHVNAYSAVPVERWLECWAPYIFHFHIHNNDGSRDAHDPLNQGDIPIRQLLARAQALCPDATFTLELMKTEPSVRWLFG
ncbi:MAG: sugar phosphate isomerase/epimerase [Oscillospiraceae bacterium]|nr:sugar phosphate isomerase/epimerase [Oscillospiraceae bacterium]